MNSVSAAQNQRVSANYLKRGVGLSEPPRGNTIQAWVTHFDPPKGQSLQKRGTYLTCVKCENPCRLLVRRCYNINIPCLGQQVFHHHRSQTKRKISQSFRNKKNQKLKVAREKKKKRKRKNTPSLKKKNGIPRAGLQSWWSHRPKSGIIYELTLSLFIYACHALGFAWLSCKYVCVFNHEFRDL